MNRFQNIADEHEILRAVVGSGVHGIAIDGTDDRDEMGVFIEPPEYVFGMAGRLGTVIYRDAGVDDKGKDARSKPGDLDLVRYSLRKYVRLALKGNPNILLLLFVPDDDLITCKRPAFELRALTNEIVSKHAVYRTLGYLRDQLDGLTRNRKLPKRPELIEKYGFDTKYASHAVRLGIQAWELAAYGEIALPMREDLRQTVRAVKTGEYDKNQVLDMVERWQVLAEAALASSPLRDEPDIETINKWIVRAHLQHWSIAGLAGESYPLS